MRLRAGGAARPWGAGARAAFLGAAGLYAGARLWRLTAASLDTDEIFALLAVRRGWSGFLAPVASAAHPPLFYVLLKVWTAAGGESKLWLRLLPALLSTASLVPFALLCRRLRVPPAAANVALLLLALNAFLVSQAQRARMYGLVELLALASLWLFVKLVEEEGRERANLLALTTVNALLVSAHYFAGLLVGVQMVFLLAWARRRVAGFAVAGAALAACLAPWAVWAARASVERAAWGEDLGWVARPALSNLALHYATLNGLHAFRGNVWLGALLFGGPVLALAWRVFAGRGSPAGEQAESGRDERAALSLLLLCAFLPALVVFAASRALPYSIWIPRYLIFTAAPYLLLVALAASRLRPRALSAGLLALMLGWAAVPGLSYLAESERRVSWEDLARRVRRAEPAGARGVRIYAVGYNASAPLDFYLDEAGETRFEVVRVRRRELAAVEGEHFWVAYRAAADERRPTPRDTLAARGFRVGEELVSAGVGEEARLLPVWRE